MATNITDWAPLILPDIPGLPIPALIVAVRDAAIEFCQETLLWFYTCEDIDVVTGQQVYDLEVEAAECGEIINIDTVKYKEDGADDDHYRTLFPTSESQMDLDQPGSWRYITSTAPTHYFGNANDKTLMGIYPVPLEDSDEGMWARVNLRPTDDCTTLPDFLWSEYRKIIAHGALAELFLKKGMPWYDPQQAGIERARFANGFSKGKWDKITGPTIMPVSVKMRPFV